MVFAAAKHSYVFIIEPKHYLLPNNKGLQSLDLQIYLPQYLSWHATRGAQHEYSKQYHTQAVPLSAHGGVSMIYAQVLLSFESERERGVI